MPCYTINTISLKLGAINFEYMIAGLRELGLTPIVEGKTVFFGNGESYNHDTNELRVVSQERVSQIRQATSAALLKAKATQFGWKMTQIVEKKGVVNAI